VQQKCHHRCYTDNEENTVQVVQTIVLRSTGDAHGKGKANKRNTTKTEQVFSMQGVGKTQPKSKSEILLSALLNDS